MLSGGLGQDETCRASAILFLPVLNNVMHDSILQFHAQRLHFLQFFGCEVVSLFLRVVWISHYRDTVRELLIHIVVNLLVVKRIQI